MNAEERLRDTFIRIGVKLDGLNEGSIDIRIGDYSIKRRTFLGRHTATYLQRPGSHPLPTRFKPTPEFVPVTTATRGRSAMRR